MPNILILNCEASNTLPFIWYYNHIGYTVIGAGNGIIPTGFLSKYIHYRIYVSYPNPMIRKSREYFIRKIKETCRKYKIDLILGFFEETIEPIVNSKKTLVVRDIFPSYRSYKILYDKSILKEHLESENFRSFRIPASFKEPYRFPCIIKPHIGKGGEYVRICTNYHELKKYFKMIELAKRKPIIEEYIPFQDRIIMNLLIDRKFKIKRVVVRELVERDKLLNCINELEDFFKKIRYFGFASPQFLVKNGELYLTEINPRLSYVVCGIDCGVNFPEGFHNAIVKNDEIEKKFVFVPKNYPRNNVWHFLRMCKDEYEDVLPLIVDGMNYLKFYIENKIKLFTCLEYKKWVEIFKTHKIS
jgi:predicted ATP-grasp superfamily ATP-dependent carboligase